MNISFLQQKKDCIVHWIDEFFTERQDVGDRVFGSLPVFVSPALTDYIFRGKFLRGALVYAGYDAAGAGECDVTPVAAAMELFHSGFLIKDDIMDDDNRRRGGLSLHVLFGEMVSRRSSQDIGRRTGISMALCVSDLCYFLALEALDRESLPHERKSALNILFRREIQRVGAGQILDLDNGTRPAAVTEEEILSCYSGKTAGYTISLPLRAGVLCSGRRDTVLETAFSEFGETLGLIFQLRDDELGLSGTGSVTGKPVGSDIRAGKATLHMARLIPKLTDIERERVERIVGEPDASDKDIRFVTELMDQTGVMDSVASFIADRSAEAERIIAGMPVDERYRELFRTLLHYSVSRGK